MYNRFSKRDLLFSITTGFYTGFIAWLIFEFLHIPRLNGFSFAWFMLLVPVLWILGVNLGYFLGRWFPFFNQFGKFAAIGFTNSAVDFGVLNLLIFYSGVSAGVLFPIFKGISFVISATHSYFWNKYWSFRAGSTEVSSQEFFKFFSVTVGAFLINVTVASIIVNIIGIKFGLSSEAWANVGALAGSATALIASFIGFKKVVFKK